ncbi:hypothetical protein O9X80_06445 [Agrobacterium salinitolerans]|nr:hypothetical protein [Agrobacterium salinitolerans]
MSRPFEDPEVIAEMERRKVELMERYGYDDQTNKVGHGIHENH